MFHHNPRYDCILYHAAAGKQIFGQLHLIFTCTVNNAFYALALVEPLDAPIPRNSLGRQQQQMDWDLEFFRVRSRQKTEIIPVQSIVRGALLVPDWEKDGDYFVHDLVDGDMFLRLKGLRPI